MRTALVRSKAVLEGARAFLSRHRFAIAFGLIITAALWVRWVRAPFGLPYLHHWDEPLVASKALEMLKSGNWNPREFWYGSLLMYLNMALDAVHFLRLAQLPVDAPEAASHLSDIRTGLETGWTWTISHPSFYLINRRLTAFLGAISVAALAHIAWRLGGVRLALLAGLGLAFARNHVQHSAFVTTDVPSLCCFLLAASFSLELAARKRLGWLAAAAVAVGAGASIKYNVAVAGLIPLFTLLAIWRQLTPLQRRRAPWILLGVPALVFFAGTPYALLDSPQFLDHMAFNFRTYKVLGHAYSTSDAGWPNLRRQLEDVARGTPGWLLAAAPLGLLLLLRRRAGWPFLIAAVLYLAAMSNMRIAFHRNFLLFYPLVALGGAAVVDALVRWLRREHDPPNTSTSTSTVWRRRLAVATLGLATLGLVWNAVAVSRDARRFGRKIETRSLFAKRLAPVAKEWGWKRIGWAEELRMHPLDLGRIEAEHHELPTRELFCAGGRFDAVVLPTGTVSQGKIPALQERAIDLEQRLMALPAVLGVAGGDTSINVYSVNPGVQVISGNAPELRARCGRIDLVLVRSPQAETRADFAFALPPEATARQRPVWLPAGRYEIVWRIGPAERASPELAVTLTAELKTVGSGGDAEIVTLGEKRFGLPRNQSRRTFAIELPHDGELRVRWTTGALDPETADDLPGRRYLAILEEVHLRKR